MARVLRVPSFQFSCILQGRAGRKEGVWGRRTSYCVFIHGWKPAVLSTQHAAQQQMQHEIVAETTLQPQTICCRFKHIPGHVLDSGDMPHSRVWYTSLRAVRVPTTGGNTQTKCDTTTNSQTCVVSQCLIRTSMTHHEGTYMDLSRVFASSKGTAIL